MANEVRGELSIAFEGVAYVLRPSFAAITAIENKTGRSLLQLAGDAGDGSLNHDHAAAIVTECMKAWGIAGGDGQTPEQRVAAQVNAKRIAELIYEEGLLLVAKRLELLLFRACTGGYAASGEAKATGTNMTGIPAAA